MYNSFFKLFTSSPNESLNERPNASLNESPNVIPNTSPKFNHYNKEYRDGYKKLWIDKIKDYRP